MLSEDIPGTNGFLTQIKAGSQTWLMLDKTPPLVDESIDCRVSFFVASIIAHSYTSKTADPPRQCQGRHDATGPRGHRSSTLDLDTVFAWGL